MKVWSTQMPIINLLCKSGISHFSIVFQKKNGEGIIVHRMVKQQATR
uniref:Uncharacterized protein n=1 Tax=Arundo donax TaxID=35708 RepID=A0A0A9ALH3_ARUDO